MQAGARRIAMLQQTPLFGGIRAEVLALLLEHCNQADMPTGGYFFREGDPAESMYLLESGSVEVLHREAETEAPLCRLGPGACFGEMGMIDLAPRSASVRALEDCTGFEIFAEGLYTVYQHDLEQFTLIQMNIARELSRRLRAADARAACRHQEAAAQYKNAQCAVKHFSAPNKT